MTCSKEIHQGEEVLRMTKDRPMDVEATIGVLARQDLDNMSLEERRFRHERNITSVIVHVRFKKHRPFDIALLRMDRPLPEDGKSPAICLPMGSKFPDLKMEVVRF